MRPFITFIFLSLTLQTAFAVQELETIVRETKFNSSSRIVIDKEEIEKSRAKNLTSLLAVQANVSIAQSNFTPTTIFLRGGDSSHVLILVDGVPFYDTSSPQKTTNLNSLDLKSIQRIEVIKGSQSVLYGGQALAGVIKIDTLPKDFKSSGQLLIQNGFFQKAPSSSAAAGGVIGLSEEAAFIVHSSYSEKKSLSPVLNSTKLYPTSLSTGEIAFVHKSVVSTVLKLQTSFDRTYIPTTSNPQYGAADTDDFTTSTYQVVATGILTGTELILKPQLSVSAQQSMRLYEQDSFASGGFPTKREYVGDLLALRLGLTPVENQFLVLKVGASLNQEQMNFKDKNVLKTEEKDEFEGIFAKAEVLFHKNIQLELGSRLDYHKMKDSISTNQIGLTLYETFKLEYATGFKQPSLFQLYGNYGNLDLKPEKSTSYSVTAEKPITQSLHSSITAFETKFENLILPKGSPLRYENISSSKTQGIELATSYRLLEQGLYMSLTLGYQEPKDNEQSNWLPKRPLRTAGLKVRKEIEKLGFGFEMVHNGDRRDSTSLTTYGTINAYTLVHATAEYKPTENLALFTRVQNIFDQRYESSYGFYDEGINTNVGAEFSF